ncbi:unnamed protein product [Orchesella dallaii]|uniref:Reverse transcriptase domain-containing protein n=1 Tax=Orchesella dallaii TaxID=48710 RepID=A0ABP1S018_9HEXA
MTYVIYKHVKQKTVPKIIKYRCFKSLNSELFSEEISKVDWSFLTNTHTFNDGPILFEKLILGILNKHAPVKSRIVKGFNAPWFNQELVLLCKNRDEIGKKLKLNPNLLSDYRQAKNQANYKISQAKKKYFLVKFHAAKSSIDVWNCMNELICFRHKNTTKINSLVNSEGIVLQHDFDICKQLAQEFVVLNSESNVKECLTLLPDYENNYFKKHKAAEDNLNIQSTNTEGAMLQVLEEQQSSFNVNVNDSSIDSNLMNFPPLEELTVSSNNVENAIKYVKKCKQSIDNNIPTKIYKEYANLLSIPLTIIFTNIFSLCQIPKYFKLADVTALYKGKGSRSQSSSYRAIFNFPFNVKVFEKILCDKLVYFTNKHLDSNQHGFRQRRSCETANAVFTQHIYEYLDCTGGKAMAVFIDFSKAFDSINQKLLIQKLMNNFDHEIPPKLLRLLIDYFSDRQFRICNGNYESDYFNIRTGVPPGSNLGPICYSLFINDIGQVIYLPYILYADDLVIYSACKTWAEGREELSQSLNLLSKWCDDNNLKINLDKTKYMCFYKPNDHKSRAQLTDLEPLLLNGCPIERVEKFTYLGVTVDSCLSFKDHFKSVDNKITNALARMYSLRRFISESVMKTFLSAYVVSIVDYCAIVWLVQKDSLTDKLQHKIDRFILIFYSSKKLVTTKTNKRVEISEYYLKLDLYSLHERKRLSLVKFVFKKRYYEIFRDWFKFRNNCRFDRIILPSHCKEIYKQSVKWKCIDAWNYFLQKLLLADTEELDYDTFVDMCKNFLKKERNKIYC